jgi:hypothetical protein
MGKEQKMKKLTIYALLILLICGTLISCGKKESDSGKDVKSDASVSGTSDTTGGEKSEYSLSGSLASIVPGIAPAPTWKALNQIYDEDLISEFFGLDVNSPNYAELTVWQCGLSTEVEEIILIKAADGKIDDAVADLKKRREHLINVDTYYPDDKATAEKSLVGNLGEFCYFIAGENATSALENLKLVLTGKSVAGGNSDGDVADMNSDDNAATGNSVGDATGGTFTARVARTRPNMESRITATLPAKVKSAIASINARNEARTEVTQPADGTVTIVTKRNPRYNTPSERKALYEQIVD